MGVSESAYHAYAKGQSYLLSAMKALTARQVAAVFAAHGRRYGARRIAAQLKAQDIQVGRFQVGTMMRRQNLQAIGPRRFVPRTTQSRDTLAPSPNLLLEAANAPQKRREVIGGDITYLPLRSGKWAYLASWQDKFSRRVVGWAVEERMTAELVIKAFAKAIKGGGVARRTIIHTDQGSQYVSTKFRALLQAQGCRQSMSRRGNCYDNAMAESFFSRYKAELLEGGVFEDVSQARSETFTSVT
jgi:putative transposase